MFKEDETSTVPPTDIPVPEESEKIPAFVLHASGRAEDITNVRSMGLQVDDNNDPAPENNKNINQSESRE